jgi:hypothetical protein
MSAHPVEWVLVICYGRSAHRATYGRLNDTKYTKDYIQLSRKQDFLDTVSSLFPVSGGGGTVPLTYQWPTGTTRGAFVFQSADRPHLKWETNLGAPKAWKMSLDPSDANAETIPGDPSHSDFTAAENEFAQLGSRGAGQPYLLAVKLRDEPYKLHLRAYLGDASQDFAWADLQLLPQQIRELAATTTPSSALAWSSFQSGGVMPSERVIQLIAELADAESALTAVDGLDAESGRELAAYLRQPGYGLFFDPSLNHDSWFQGEALPANIAAITSELIAAIDARFPAVPQDDAAAERMEVDPNEVRDFRDQIEHRRFEVRDSTSTVKTRGSAQKAFAEAVKANYGMRCAITGIESRGFLIAAHIVPWSKDQTIRLDPSNGICLSSLVDRAFESGYLIIEDDFTIRINNELIGTDSSLRSYLEPYDGARLYVPSEGAPRVEYLQRKRALVLEGL